MIRGLANRDFGSENGRSGLQVREEVSMSDEWPSILARTGLEKTYGEFPDDVREALASALGLVERMKAEPAYADEPAHVFQAARALENEA